MGVSKSKQDLHYMRGLPPLEYYKKEIIPEISEVYDILNIDEKLGRTMYMEFIKMDADGSGDIDIDEFHKWFKFKMTSFSQRIFGIVDLDSTGKLNFTEYTVGLWNYLTLNTKSLTKYTFDIFDTDQSNSLDIPECDALLRMLNNTDTVTEEMKRILELMDANGDGVVTVDEFLKYNNQYPLLLEPAIEMQRILRKKFLGAKVWEIFCKYRIDSFGEFESIENILLSKRREKTKQQEELESKIELEKQEKEAEIVEKKIEYEKLVEERKLVAEKRRIENLTEEELLEGKLYEQLQDTKDKLKQGKEEENSLLLTETRKNLKRLVPKYIAAKVATYTSIRKHMHQEALITAENRCQDYMCTPDGQILLKEIQEDLIKLEKEKMKRKSNFIGYLAPPTKEIKRQTLLQARSRYIQNEKQKAAIAVDESFKDMKKDVERSHEVLNDYLETELQLETDNTFEKLYDPTNSCHYWMNHNTGVSLWFDPPMNVRLCEVFLEGSMLRPVSNTVDPKWTRDKLLEYAQDQFRADRDKYGHIYYESITDVSIRTEILENDNLIEMIMNHPADKTMLFWLCREGTEFIDEFAP